MRNFPPCLFTLYNLFFSIFSSFHREDLELYHILKTNRMKFFVVNRSRLTVTQMADRLKRCSNLKEVESLYAMMIKNDRTQNCFLVNQYITACSTFRNIDSAIFAFSEMENPNVFVYNAIIGAFVNCFRPFEALQYYIDMLRNAVYPSSYTFPAVTKSCRVLSAVGFGECVHGQIWKYGFPSHVHVQTALVDFHSSLGKFVEARMVFDEMPERDGFAWSTMIEAHSGIGDLASARRLFDEMPEKNTAAWNTMIHGYARVGDVNSAEELFYMMHEKDLISWTTMINCYAKSKQYSKALELFYEMKNEEVRPDEVTMSTVISACAHLGALNRGKEIHIYAMQSGFDLDVHMGSALIDMYAKSGVLERALVVFYKLREKNLFCWNSVIDGLAVHGHAEEALGMFGRMEKEKIKPNGVTFVSILNACTHAGLVEEGRRRFFNMTQKYRILPEIEHYGCMIDLLCKAGLLEEALELIQGMRMDPNSVVWGALLGGCKLHKNLEIAQVAVDRLIVLESNNSSGYYSLLVNMYAEANRWHEVARIRTIMKEHGVEKRSPGSSWVEVDEKTHQFSACDNYHPASGEIYSLLDVLDAQLKLISYAPFQFDFTL